MMDFDKLPNLETTMNKILVKLMNGYVSIDYPSTFLKQTLWFLHHIINPKQPLIYRLIKQLSDRNNMLVSWFTNRPSNDL